MGSMCAHAPSAGLDLLHMADVSCMVRPGRPLPVLIRSTQGQFAVLGGDFRLENWFSRFSEVILEVNFGYVRLQIWSSRFRKLHFGTPFPDSDHAFSGSRQFRKYLERFGGILLGRPTWTIWTTNAFPCSAFTIPLL